MLTVFVGCVLAETLVGKLNEITGGDVAVDTDPDPGDELVTETLGEDEIAVKVPLLVDFSSVENLDEPLVAGAATPSPGAQLPFEVAP